MRILSWNINGIRTLPQYHPWNTYKSCEAILDALQADVVCFQEMKTSRSQLQRDTALPGPYHSFFSFPFVKGGYSGVAVYTDSRKVTALKAEEGLSGKLQPKPPLSEEERVSHTYPSAHHIDLFADEQDEVPANFDMLDSEGRALVLDFGLFVLINVYCPAETSDTRLPFKMNFHLMLQERVRKLIEEEHREVMVVGDINVSATPLDHCDGHLPSNAATFWDHPARAWFRNWLNPNGPMIDAIRMFWPERKGLYTCWNTKISARETNYGARIDYILITQGLLPWVKHGDIQQSLKGSDHCPIYIDMHDELVLESGVTLRLRDAMKQVNISQPPRIAATFWEEFSGKQTVLSAFFGKRDSCHHQPKPGSLMSSSSVLPGSTALPASSTNERSFETRTCSKSSSNAVKPRPALSTAKRKSSEKASGSNSNKRKKTERRQASIASFFDKPSTEQSESREVIELVDDDSTPSSTAVTSDSNLSQTDRHVGHLDADYRLACELSAQTDDDSDQLRPSSAQSSQNHRKGAWSSLFAPVQPPKCTVHGEPTKLYTVNKQGPNKGKTFYICSRPVGPGYDKGKGERLREEVNHEFRCNFFKWASEVKKEVLRGQFSKKGSDTAE
ncbi:hypothetical protein AcW2_005766 [Taiwanofungus camphoratus]|nr:hypothetical protein AcW2_005766 [Antrodia cinnamomea]